MTFLLMPEFLRTVTTSAALRRLLLHCQTQCTADCCKENAFDLSKRSIEEWLAYERIDRSKAIGEEMATIADLLRKATGRLVLDVRDLRSDWKADRLLAFWQVLLGNFALATGDQRDH